MALLPSFLWLRNIPFGEGNGNSLQYSCQENPMDRGVWQTTVHKVAGVGHDLVIKPPIFHYTVCVCVCVCVCVHILLRTADKGPSSHMDGFSSCRVWM